MKTILILLDTLRKDCLKIYNDESKAITPNIDILANDSVVFDNHCTGSMPCMPARRDILTGNLDFFERFWAGLEPFDLPLTHNLSDSGVKTHIITDHYHYWEIGGEGYLQSYDTFEMIRGNETDPYIANYANIEAPDKLNGNFKKQFEINLNSFKSKEDYPTVKTFLSAADFMEKNIDREDFFLQIEGFDPHEPFATPKEFLDLYGISEDDLKEYYNSPKYGECTDTEEELEFIRNKYLANVSFADYAVGIILTKLKKLKIYDECTIILTTDHGLHLGEHNVMGKGTANLYNEVSEIPLLIKTAKNDHFRVNNFTQNIDLMPTILDMYNVNLETKINGCSLKPLLNRDKSYMTRECAVSGYHGASVMLKSNEYTLFVAPVREDNTPLFHYSAMPSMFRGYFGAKRSLLPIDPKYIESGHFLSKSKMPVYKVPFAFEGVKSFHVNKHIVSQLFKNSDVEQLNPIVDKVVEERLKIKLVEIMSDLDVPQEQYQRLGLINYQNN
ncbi:MAG: sulfatase [Anaerorhabdus sp.]